MPGSVRTYSRSEEYPGREIGSYRTVELVDRACERRVEVKVGVIIRERWSRQRDDVTVAEVS